MMAIESAQQFYNDYTSGRVVFDSQKLESADIALKSAYLKSLGYDFTQDEMSEILDANGRSMTLDEAESVVGGRNKDRVVEISGGVLGVLQIAAVIAA